MNNSKGLRKVNPFHVQWKSSFFVGRQDELRVFEGNLGGLKGGDQSHLLVAGVHGTGKSFYLNKLAEIARSAKCVAVIVNCPESTPIEQARSILRETITALQTQTASRGSPPRTSIGEDFEKNEQSQFFSLPKRTDLGASDLQHDFRFLVDQANAAGRDGVVVCIDEGQRATRVLLSCLKNAVSQIPSILIVLSWRLASDTGGAVPQARKQLENRMVDTEQDKDIGAGSFFLSGTAMGPFKTDAEVANYFSARLTGNAVNFPPEIVLRLGQIAGRVPRPMTELAHDVYDAAVRMEKKDVEVSLIDECFRIRYPAEVKQATDLCADLSVQMMTVLKALCRSSGPATALELVKNAFPNTPDTHYEIMQENIGMQLDKISQTSVILKRTENKYDIIDAFHRYALKLTVGTP